MNAYARIRPIKAEDIEPLVAQAAEDNHAVVAPNFLVSRGDETIGYLNIGTVPTVILWMDTRKARVRDSMVVMNFFENSLACNGQQHLLLPCPKTSPFWPLLPKAGYKSFGEKTIYYKEL